MHKWKTGKFILLMRLLLVFNNSYTSSSNVKGTTSFRLKKMLDINYICLSALHQKCFLAVCLFDADKILCMLKLFMMLPLNQRNYIFPRNPTLFSFIRIEIMKRNWSLEADFECNYISCFSDSFEVDFELMKLLALLDVNEPDDTSAIVNSPH